MPPKKGRQRAHLHTFFNFFQSWKKQAILFNDRRLVQNVHVLAKTQKEAKKRVSCNHHRPMLQSGPPRLAPYYLEYHLCNPLTPSTLIAHMQL